MDNIQKIIINNQELIKEKSVLLIERKIKYNLNKITQIKVLIGPRRSGKTSFGILSLKNTNVKDILYLNFEDERLIGLKIDDILDNYKKTFGKTPKKIFFDEIQELKNWDKIIHRLYESNKNIILTGSNFNLLSKDISNSLGGRVFKINILPLSFKEFLAFQKIKIDMFRNSPKIEFYFNKFLTFGGYPEVVESNYKKETIEQIFESTLYKDLISKNNLNEKLIKLILLKLTENVTNKFSYTSIKNKINPIFNTTTQTIINYLELIINSFFGFEINKYSDSFQKREKERKFYFIDNGLILKNSITISYPKLLENLVAIELFRKNKEFYYYSNSFECDFVTVDNFKVNNAIQVCYELNEGNKKREIKGLKKALDKFNLKEGLILTNSFENKIKLEDKTINIKPVWKWLLEEE